MFVDRIAAIKASNELDGKMMGGCQIKASILNGEESEINSDARMIADKNRITLQWNQRRMPKQLNQNQCILETKLSLNNMLSANVHPKFPTLVSLERMPSKLTMKA